MSWYKNYANSMCQGVLLINQGPLYLVLPQNGYGEVAVVDELLLSIRDEYFRGCEIS